MTSAYPIEAVRARFPALAATSTGRPRIYLDAPGGTQVCADAIDAMAAYMREGSANAGGCFETSRASDAMSAEAHAAMADLVGGAPGEIAFGPNMTTLTLAVSRALAQDWQADDELVVTRLDHDANVAPWLRVAADRRMTVRWLDFNPATGALHLEALASLLGPRTRLVAVGGASNALGTVNDLAGIVEIVRRHSPALVYVDAVQSVPHLPTDVAAIGCDLLAFSPYKAFGPHQGVLWGRAAVIETLDAYKVRPAASTPAAIRFETGTPSFEAQAGVLGMARYLEWLGGSGQGRRGRLTTAMEAAGAYETLLGERLLAGFAGVPDLCLFGPPTMQGRLPTFAFRLGEQPPAEIARRLADRSIFAATGNFYAIEVERAFQLHQAGGFVRIGLCHYNTMAEVDTLLEAMNEIAADRR